MAKAGNSSGRAPAPAPAIRFHEVEARKLSTRLADSITETILRSGLQAGSRLPSEREMQGQFGVGRGTLREALRVLEAEGLVSVRSGPRGGPVVTRPDANRLARLLLLLLLSQGATLRDVHNVRIVLEPLAAAIAAERADPEQIDGLRRSVDVMREAIDDEIGRIDENQRFHRSLAESSNNPVLGAFALALQTIFDGYGMGTRFPSDRWAESIRAHEGIVEAIACGDADRASAISRKHIEATISFFSESFPGLLDEPLRPTLITTTQ